MPEVTTDCLYCGSEIVVEFEEEDSEETGELAVETECPKCGFPFMLRISIEKEEVD